ncbi:integrating conjugative element relaxase, PFGI-1 class [Enterobacter sp. BIDMC 29]|uniref:conjugal transfer nickase/helicase domain-containing protein n=1 Tax=Enterobacter sp. BIDMC 29 TaxID=1329841 RepID=UPI00044DC1F2|nr:TraI domain-containing protein [Enterobacter sp. BIDMC 29]EUM16630.1 integrating conjugative element relaxase, PFGI-1 class [Enterobacter sp. BIDMC 29]
MLNKIKTLLSRAPAVTESSDKLPVSVPAGYFSPVRAEELVISALRQEALQKIRENNSLSAHIYQRFYLDPVHLLLERTQNVPAVPEGRWAYAGGFGDLSLRFTTYAVRLARGYMFPPGAAPEEQAAQGVIWQAVIFWAALCYHLPLLASIEGETTGGVSWQPGISVPDAPYRFRFRSFPPNAHGASALASLAAGQLMPTDAINWLSGTPAALFSLACAFRNGSPDMPLIRTLLDQAAEKVDSPVLQKVAGESTVAIASPDSVIPQDGMLSVQTDNNLTSSALTLVASELMTSLNDTGGGDNQPPLNGVSTVETQEDPDNPCPGQGDADMLLSLFSAVADAESTDDADENTPAITVPDETVVPVRREVPYEPADTEEVSRHSDTDADCLLPTMPGELEYPVNIGADARRPGEAFLAWLSDGMTSGRITVNQHDSRVHSVAGFIYLLVPDIFFHFLKDTGSDSHREQIQTSFEKLQLHRVCKGERFIRAKLYSSTDRQGRFSKVNGYLIKATHLKRERSFEDSKLLFFP